MPEAFKKSCKTICWSDVWPAYLYNAQHAADSGRAFSCVFRVIQAGKHILSRFWYLLFLCAILEQRRCCLVHASRKSRNVIIVVIASVREKVKAETICQADGKWLEQANRSWDKGGIRLWIQRKIALLCQCLWRLFVKSQKRNSGLRKKKNNLWWQFLLKSDRKQTVTFTSNNPVFHPKTYAELTLSFRRSIGWYGSSGWKKMDN